MKKYSISLLIGLTAAMVDVTPMLMMGMDKLFIISAFCVWLVLGLFIPRVNFVASACLNGIIVALLFVLPMAFLIYKLDPVGLPMVLGSTVVLGGAVGFFSSLFVE
jgi:hypothetical protein